MLTLNKNFIKLCILNQDIIRKYFPIVGGTIIKYKKSGIIDIISPSVILSGIDFKQVAKECFIIPTLKELLECYKKIFNTDAFLINYQNGKYHVQLNKHKNFKGESEEVVLLKTIIDFNLC